MTPADAIALADVVLGLLVVLVIAAAYLLGHREGRLYGREDAQ